MTYVYVPRVRAALALQRHAPAEAIQNLELTRLYEQRNYDVPLLRAAAYIGLKQFPQAIVEYRRVTEDTRHRSRLCALPYSVPWPCARLYCSGRHRHARQSYQILFQLWKDADPDLLALKQARIEYAKLAA